MKFLKVPNAIFEQGLSGNELKVYLYLLSCRNCLDTATVRVGTIQQRCAVASRTTVQAALNTLEQKGLVVRTRRRDRDGNYISNRYDLTVLRGPWVAVDVSAQLWQLDKSAFLVYLHLVRLCRRNGRAWPSYTAMATALGLARNTVITAIRRLSELGWLLKALVRQGKHNLYTLFAAGMALPEKERPAALDKPQVNSNTWKQPSLSVSALTVSQAKRLVNRIWAVIRKKVTNCFLPWSGGAKNEQQDIDLSFYNKEKNGFGLPAVIGVVCTFFGKKCTRNFPQDRLWER